MIRIPYFSNLPKTYLILNNFKSFHLKNNINVKYFSSFYSETFENKDRKSIFIKY